MLFFHRRSRATKPRPWLLELRSSTWFITITVATAIFTDIFLYAVIVPVFPFQLADRVGVAKEDVQYWLSILLSTYSAALLVSAPMFGWLSDRIDERKNVLLAGLIVLCGATVMLCLAVNLPLLIVGRLLQGASAGVVWVTGLALLADTVGKEHAGQAMGYVGLAYSAAALIAPLLGGVVYAQAGYYAVFAMCFGMIGLDIVLRLLLIEKKVAKRWLVVDDVEPGQHGGARLEPIEPQSPTAAKDMSVPDTEAQVPDQQGTTNTIAKKLPPMLILLKSKRMQATFWACAVTALTLTVFDVTLPLFVEQTFHWSSVGAGVIFLALLLPSFFQPLFGWMVDKHGPKWMAGIGLLVCIVPYICLRFVDHNSMSQKVLLCALLFIIGIGVCLALAATMTEFTVICIEKEQRQPGSMGRGGAYAQSYSLFNVSWALGSLVGAYWAGGIKQAAGWGTMGWSLAILCAAVSVPTFIYVGGSLFKKNKNEHIVADSA
ncbi:hypothetical protein LTR05_002143 [Lithohypha guttulata]|uniref:Major facilitator superfamily (MFS) profile domain-containing protein n=1 Tax=Lithohypha guttulata TaxID=1690604 RepID=A0AAN7T445_9EURO|nr:hypothetical protein LTR05_002143 [Lithohypha guttulata]